MGERKLLRPAELWHKNDSCAKAVEGQLLDLRRHRPGEDDPVGGRTWGRDRWIRAQVLFQLLTGNGPPLAETVVAVRLRGAHIVGRLNVGGWKLRCPLELYECYLRYRLDLAKWEALNINLRGSYLRFRLSAWPLKVTHTLNLSNGFRCDRGVVLRDAQIKGVLECTEAVFTNPNGACLSAERLTVDASMFLRKSQCTGEVRLVNAHIGRGLDCTEGVFTNSNGACLSAERMAVNADMCLGKARCTGKVGLTDAHIRGQLDCTEATFTGSDLGPFALFTGSSFAGDGLTVDASTVLEKAQCIGEVRLLGAHIKGELNCRQAVFTNGAFPAFSADGLTVGADVDLGNVQCTGEL